MTAHRPLAKSAVNTLVVISDTHVGGRTAIAPPIFKLDGGGTVNPSKLQQGLQEWWKEFWFEFVPKATKGEPYSVVHNGDCVDGVPHGSVSHMSALLDDQCNAAIALLAPVIKKAEAFYMVRGTEAHVSKNGELEERVAKALDATPDSEGRCARWELWKTLGNRMIHFLHHIGTTGSAAYEASAVNAELVAEMVEAARWGLSLRT